MTHCRLRASQAPYDRVSAGGIPRRPDPTPPFMHELKSDLGILQRETDFQHDECGACKVLKPPGRFDSMA